jgi:hypothetical protein
MLFSGIHHFHTNNEPRSGGSKTATTPEIVDNIHDVVLVNRRIKVSEIAEAVSISCERVLHIFHNELDLKKLSGKLSVAFAQSGAKTRSSSNIS